MPILFVVGELDSTVYALRISQEGRLDPFQVVSCLPDNFIGFSRASAVVLSPDGARLHVSNRGHDSICTFDVVDGGRLASPSWTGSDGRTPRFACYNPEGTGLLVANEESDTIVSIPSGGSGPAVLVARAASPTCIAFRHGPPGKLSAPTRVMTAVSTRRPARVSIIVGIILLASAIVVAFDANRIQGGFTYGSSPAAVPYVVAGFLGLLWINHFIAAFRSETAEAGPAD